MNIVVLLAAGESSRTTTMKQLYTVNGEYLINMQIRTLLSYGYKVAVVLGHNYEKISAVLDKDIRVIQNKEYSQGMFSSVKMAFKVLEAQRFIFCHVDRPIADKNVFELLLKCNSEIATAFFNNKKAPPIMIQSSMKTELLNSSLHRLDYWIESTSKVSYIDVDDKKIHFNANTDEELGRYFD
ncbi:MAG: NTP transferase domain-containing protein [Campylobacterota bacterium]|nr:NTP transferase domain-containing protein [Campylobacterota bacterium]